MERHHVSIDPNAEIGELRAAERTMIAVVRALSDEAGTGSVIVFDEATAALPAPEVDLLLSLIASLKADGATILYVTHRLGEVFRIADRVTVLRDGRRVATETVSAMDHDVGRNDCRPPRGDR